MTAAERALNEYPVTHSPACLAPHSAARRYAGYWKSTSYLKEVSRSGPTVYYDSVTGARARARAHTATARSATVPHLTGAPRARPAVSTHAASTAASRRARS